MQRLARMDAVTGHQVAEGGWDFDEDGVACGDHVQEDAVASLRNLEEAG
jgi:hypothetical protein